jgi:hypothetical protein
VREDDRRLNEVAGAVLAGSVSQGDYHRLWAAVMGERRRELLSECVDMECGHAWVDGQRRWSGGQPTPMISCRRCGAESISAAEAQHVP